jgi:signal transduction histidine kinase/ligand-binding sensor domain-containing protein
MAVRAEREQLLKFSHLALRVLWLAALYSYSALAWAQYGFQNWTVEDGLPQNLIRGIAQTPDGYLWIATLDGLVRFDGVRFTVFNRSNTPGIVSNRFGGMNQGRDGDLWLDNEIGGITRYHQGSFQNYGKRDGIARNSVNGVTVDDAGDLWVLSRDRIERWDETTDRFVDIAPNDAGIMYRSLRWDNAGFWAPDGRGLRCFVRGRILSFPLPLSLSADKIWGAAIDQGGTLWIETLDGKQVRITPDKLSHTVLPNMASTVTYRESHGESLTMVVGHALSRTLEFISSGKAVSVPVARLFQDRQGNLWIGTEGDGLYRLQSQPIHVISKEQGLADRDEYAVYEDHSGAVWVGAWPVGLSRFTNGKSTNYSKIDGLPGTHVTAILEERDGHVWVAAHGGLSVLDPGDRGHFRRPDKPSLPKDAVVQAMHQDRSGALWFGTNQGLARLQEGVTQLFTTREGLSSEDVRVIAEDTFGDLWIGGFGGVARLHDGQFTRWTKADGLPSNNIWSMYIDSDQVLWIGTYDGGLARFKEGKFTSYSERDGLFNDGVFQILDDGLGNFWISCNRGIYRVSKRELNEFADGTISRITSVSYGKVDGMLSAECNGGILPAGTKTRDGKLWFPTQDGVAVIDPKTIAYDSPPLPVIIEGSLLDRVPTQSSGQLRITPGTENLEIQYTAPSFLKPESIHFKYRLEGLESRWVDAGSRRSAFYSHLPPGKYLFHVVADNTDGVWNETGKTLAVIVLAPFYRTSWFLALVSLLVAVLIAMAWRYRVAQLDQARAVQQAFSRQLIASQENERKRIAAELHDSLGQRLVVINNLALFSLRAQKRTNSNADAGTIEEIGTEAALAIQETREISYNLRPFQLDRLGLSKAVEGVVRTVSKASGIHFSSEIDNIDDLFPEELRINFYRIVQESLNNIMKHAQATEAIVHVKRSQERMILTIQDNGRGFTPGSRSAQTGQNGFGVTGMAERASLLGGEFKLRSVPGSGTVVTVEFPLGGSNGG